MSAQTLDVKGRETRVRTGGHPALPPVLLLHGIGRSLEDWTEQHDRLADRHHVISLDLPGFGFSQRSPDLLTPRSLADGVLATLDVLGEQRPVHVVGNSLGGAVAMRLLVQAPDRVRSLTLVDSAGFGTEVAAILRLITVPIVGRNMLRVVSRQATVRSERALFHNPAVVTRERVDHAMRVARQPRYAEVFAETARSLGTFRGVSAPWRADLLAEVAQHPKPTLIVWGDRDQILPVSHLAAARRAFPHAETHVFTSTGHMPQIERADAFATRLLDFLAAA